ncbi:helix-turn-helix transcriptional regulator [Porticoccaceae bacterium]|nr:helix-turn-helix transcriptional regulator [Porticoccaceae bacterium]
MDEMIDSNLIKQLRAKQAWTQDELATVTSLSHRTIQRIETDGVCSLESKKALAAAFGVNASELSPNTSKAASNIALKEAANRGRKYGVVCASAGIVSAYIGVTHSFVNGTITSGEAGIYYGSLGAFCGICCALMGMLSNRSYSKTA